MALEFIYPKDPQQENKTVDDQRENHAVQKILIFGIIDHPYHKEGDPQYIQYVYGENPCNDKAERPKEFSAESYYKSRKQDHYTDGIATFYNTDDRLSIYHDQDRWLLWKRYQLCTIIKYGQGILCLAGNQLRHSIGLKFFSIVLIQEKLIDQNQQQIGKKELT